jgi:hypothetical protein
MPVRQGDKNLRASIGSGPPILKRETKRDGTGGKETAMRFLLVKWEYFVYELLDGERVRGLKVVPYAVAQRDKLALLARIR